MTDIQRWDYKGSQYGYGAMGHAVDGEFVAYTDHLGILKEFTKHEGCDDAGHAEGYLEGYRRGRIDAALEASEFITNLIIWADNNTTVHSEDDDDCDVCSILEAISRLEIVMLNWEDESY